jgi:hypothetical protein
VQFVAAREACVLTAHRDTALLAIGFGQNDASLDEGDTISMDRAIALLMVAADEYDRSLNIIFAGSALAQHQYDAAFSLMYNVGATWFRSYGGRPLVKAVADHAASPGDRGLRDATGFAFVCAKYDPDAGPFNLSRRCREALMYVQGDYGDLSTLKLWREGKSPRHIPPDPFETVPMPRLTR